MSEQAVIGKIQSQAGEVSVTGANGEVREVQPGDALYAGDTVSTGASSTVVIELADGSRKGMASDSSVTLDESLLVKPAVETAEAASEAVAVAETAPSAPVLGAEVGSVASVSGSAVAVAPDGTSRPLAAGDSLFAGEKLETADMSLVIIELADGSRRGLSSNATLALEAVAAAAPVLAAASPSAVAEVAPAVVPKGAVAAARPVSADADVAALQAAIEEGADPSQEAEATAAGAEQADGGHSAVIISRSSQATTAASGFDTLGGEPRALAFEVDPEAFSALVAALSAPDVAGPIRTIVDLIKDLIDHILDTVEDLVDDITDFLDDITDAIDQFLDNPDISDLLNNIIEAVQDLGNDVIDNLQDLITDVIDWTNEAVTVIIDTIVTLIDRVEELTGIDLIETLGPIGAAIETVIETARDATGTLGETLTQVGSDVNGLIDGVQGDGSLPTGVNPLIDTVQDVATMDGDGNTYNDNQPNPDAMPGDSGLVDVVEDRLDPIFLQEVKDRIAEQTGESGYDMGDRLVHGERSVTRAVDNVIPNAREHIVDEAYNVPEEIADSADQALFSGGDAQQLPEDFRGAFENQQVSAELMEMPTNIEQFIGKTAADLQGVAEAGQESLAGGYEGDTSEAGGDDPVQAALDELAAAVLSGGSEPADLQQLADAGALPVSQSFSPALGALNAEQPVSSNLFSSDASTIVLTSADAQDGVFELHDTSVSLIQIEGFSGDSMLDISDLLKNQQFDPAQDDVSHYLQVTSDEAGNAVLNIGSDESGTFETAQQIVLTGVGQSEALLSQLNLGGDSSNPLSSFGTLAGNVLENIA